MPRNGPSRFCSSPGSRLLSLKNSVSRSSSPARRGKDRGLRPEETSSAEQEESSAGNRPGPRCPGQETGSGRAARVRTNETPAAACGF